MASAYPYLMASLPMLSFGAKPPFTLRRFLEICSSQIPQGDLDAVRLACAERSWDNRSVQNTLACWRAFEIGLRNELVKIRAVRRKLDPEKHLHAGAADLTWLAHSAMNSHRIVSAEDSERFLDQVRWDYLEELAAGHYFDLDALVVYALKLKIILRWQAVAGADRQYLLAKAASAAKEG